MSDAPRDAGLTSFAAPIEAVVVGASGGLGGALCDALVADGGVAALHRLSRSGPIRLDLRDEASIAAAAAANEAPNLVIVATGQLHGPSAGPEKRLSDLSAERLAESFAVNTIGPALVLKHFAPRLPRRGKAVIAVLTARVGSIADNRSGGWYGYRAAKAAANQIVRTAAIELRARRPDAVCVALHPGTVDTDLSRPFQKALPPGQLVSPQAAARNLLRVIDGLAPGDSGRFFAWDGQEIAF